MQQLWSQVVPAPLAGLVLAREAGWILAWDDRQGLHLFNHQGDLQARIEAPGSITASCAAEDGGSFALATGDGDLALLAPDLRPRWQRHLPQAITALALDGQGEVLAVADSAGQAHLIDRSGKTLWQVSLPRPLYHLAFVPEKPLLVGCSDFGLVVCLDRDGKLLWRDGLVAHVGSLAVSGTGEAVVLACYSDGLCIYAHDRGTPERVPVDVPCQRAALSYSGELVLTASQAARACLWQLRGEWSDLYPCETPPIALALGPLGNPVVVGLKGGNLHALQADLPRGLR